MGKRDALVEAYLGALDARAVLIQAAPNGQPARISTEADPQFNLFAVLWFSKSAHAELVLAQCPAGWVDVAPAALRDEVINAAAALGAPWRTTEEVRVEASIAVAEIIASVEASRQSGGLAQVNASYKIYRQQQVAKGEKAMPYSAHLQAFTRSLVVLAAQNARPTQWRSES